MEKNDIFEEEESLWDKAKDFFKYNVLDFIDRWIWPAWCLQNFFWYRYDTVKMPELKRYEYCDIVERMLFANKALVDHFIEKEKPEEHVVWYGTEGHKYGEAGAEVLYKEYEGKYIMDIIKEVYSWFHEGRAELQKEIDYMQDVWYDWFAGSVCWKKDPNDSGLYFMSKDLTKVPAELSFFKDKNLNWKILDKWLDGDRQNLVKKDFLFKKLEEAEAKLFKEDQKHLHLLIDMRPYMWT